MLTEQTKKDLQEIYLRALLEGRRLDKYDADKELQQVLWARSKEKEIEKELDSGQVGKILALMFPSQARRVAEGLAKEKFSTFVTYDEIAAYLTELKTKQEPAQ